MMFRKFRDVSSKIKGIIRNTLIMDYYRSSVNDGYVFLESRKGETVTGNIFYIIKELRENYSNLELIISIKKNRLDYIVSFFNEYNIDNVRFVETGSREYYKYLYKSKYLINDTSFPIAFIKKDEQIYLNTWHGTPLKKLGKDVVNTRDNIGNIQKNLIMADYFLYPNTYTKTRLLNSFMVGDLTNADIIYGGLPRNSILLDENHSVSLKEKLDLINKQVIVYMPTWRGTLNDVHGTRQTEVISSYLDEIDQLLSDDQVFFVKLHDYVSDRICFDNYSHIRPYPSEYETYDFLSVSDCLVTDYSSVLFDYANTMNKIVLFTYDKDEYINTRGLYLDLNDLPFPIVYNSNDLIKEINISSKSDYNTFLDEFCSYESLSASEKVCELLFDKENSVDSDNDDNVNNIMIFRGSFSKNGISSSLLSLIKYLDNDNNYYIIFNQFDTKESIDILFDLRDDIKYLVLSSGIDFTLVEALSYFLLNKFNINNKFIKSVLDIAYRRNLDKLLPSRNMDLMIQYVGYDSNITGLLEQFNGERIIYVHNDMYEETKHKTNQSFSVLKEAYNNYDYIVLVNDSLKRSVAKIKGKSKDNCLVIGNLIDYKNILNKSKEEIVFDEDTICETSLDILKSVLFDDSIVKYINIGRFSKEKGHFRLLNVFNKVYLENNDSFLIIIGGYGDLYQETLEYSKSLECKDNVIIIYSLFNPYSVLKYCDLFILSSYYEGLGLVLLEADILGVKVISTNIIGPDKLLENHCECLVDNSEDGIYNGILRFKNNKIGSLDIDYEEYNNRELEKFKNLVNNIKK